MAAPSAPPDVYTSHDKPSQLSKSKGKAKVLYDYFATNDNELSLIADEVKLRRLCLSLTCLIGEMVLLLDCL